MRDPVAHVVTAAVAAACVVLALDSPGAAAPVAEPQPIEAVTGLPREVLETKPHVVVSGTVIRTRRAKKDMIVEDASGGIWVDVDRVAAGGEIPFDPATIEPGTAVEVAGTVSPGGFSPPLSAAAVRILGTGTLPAPRSVSPERLFSGAEDCRLVELRAVLQHPKDFGDRWKITLESSARLVMAEIPKAFLDVDPRGLVDAEVLIAGPAVSLFNTRGEFLRPWVFVDRPEWFRVVTPPRAVDELPLVPLATLAGFRAPPLAGHRVRTRATVVHAVAGEYVDLQEGACGVRAVLTPGSDVPGGLPPGTVVEAVGFLDRESLVTSLRHALVTRVGQGVPPAPIAILPSRILDLNAAAAAASTMARPGDHEGCLVRFPARLVQRQPASGGGAWIVEALAADGSADAVVAVDLDAATAAALAAVEPGSRVELTGIAHVDWAALPVEWPPLVPRSVRLTVRGPDDVALVAGPPWMTRGRLLVILSLTATVLAAALGWAVALRRRLSAHTRLLVAEMRSRRDAALEFEATLRERNRLAANLHDTLQQTIAGIGFQLDACESVGGDSGDEARRHFAVARRMVHHASEELQGSVWAMRSLPLDGRPFTEVLDTLAARLAEGHDARVAVRAEGPLADLPEFVAGSILLIVQEAVHNALKHAAPTRIDVEIAADARSSALRARVTDDGRGFVVGSQAGPHEGHFGLVGMRERAERLGGRLVVRSAPGGGTTVEALVQCRDYDAALAAAPPAPG